MKKIGIVVCNYNKREYVIQCIESILNSDTDIFDIFVVDNASTDDSVKYIKEKFSNCVTLIENTSNLGGSGGFNTGIRQALKHGYKYIMCVDNDIVMEQANIRILYNILEENSSIGMIGSKICRMYQPERLQELGANINFDKCMIEPNYKDYLDNDSLPELLYCDYVPACSLMIRTEVINKIGLMPEENFIYWDDMEWGYKVNLAGYKVAASREAKVWHAMGTNSGDTYFSTYYFWRNRINFFLKYTPEEKKDKMLDVILENFFQTIYGCYYKGKSNQIKIMMYAWDDAINHRLGKASEGTILSKDIIENRVEKVVQGKSDIGIVFNNDYKLLQSIKQSIYKQGNAPQITIYCENIDVVSKQHNDCHVKSIENINITLHDMVFCFCEHVSKVTDKINGMIYIDPYSNILENQEDILHFQIYDYCKTLFIESQKAIAYRK